MNFNNLTASEAYTKSRASRAVKYSLRAEYTGTNFKEFHREQDQKAKQEHFFKQKHQKIAAEVEQEQKFYERKKRDLEHIFR